MAGVRLWDGKVESGTIALRSQSANRRKRWRTLRTQGSATEGRAADQGSAPPLEKMRFESKAELRNEANKAKSDPGGGGG